MSNNRLWPLLEKRPALLVATLLTGSACFLSSAMTPDEAAAGWIQLFDGQTLAGWSSEGHGHWSATHGVLISDPNGGSFLKSHVAFSDFLLTCDYRVPPQQSGALLLRWEKHGKSDPEGYKVQLGDNDASNPPGSLVDLLKAEAVSPRSDWRALQIEANGDHFVVQIDHNIVLDGHDAQYRTGFLGLQADSGTRIEFRNLRLKPLGLDSLFDGSDLAGWKQVAPPPPKKSKFGKLLGGGSKPKPAVWAARNNLIHVEAGPDQLQSEKTFADFVLQMQVRVESKDKKRHPLGTLAFRASPGKFDTGYKMIIHNDVNRPTGTLDDDLQMATRAIGQDNAFVTDTVVAYGRHIAIWVNGVLVNDFEDKRPDGIALTTPGAVALAHEPDSIIEFQNIAASATPSAVLPVTADLAKKTGSDAGAPSQVAAAPAPANTPPAAPMPMVVPGPSEADKQAEARRAKVSELTMQSLAAKTPEERVRINTEILQLDPSNQNAYSALQSAQQEIEKHKAAEAQQQVAVKQQSDQSANTEAQRRTALANAENALVAGDLKSASAQLAIVRKISPGDPDAQVLSARVDKELQNRKRVWYLALGALATALAGLLGLLLARRGAKEAYLEIMSGPDRGKRFVFTGEVMHIGATAQDGDAKNEVVLRDTERLISRFHCEVHRRGSKFYIFDLRSANGTFVNRKRIRPGKPVPLNGRSAVDLAGVCALRLGFEKKQAAEGKQSWQRAM